MNRYYLSIAAALASISLVAPPALAADATRTLRAEIPATGAVTIENIAGTMKVVPGKADNIVAIATVHAENEALADRIRFEKVAGEQTLRVAYPLDDYSTIRYPGDAGGASLLGRLFGGSTNTTTKYAGRRVRISSGSGVMVYADIEIQVPSRQVEAVFRNLAGRITGEGVSGTLTFDSASGEILLSRLSGKITADTGSGDVKADDLEGSFSGDTGSGDIDLARFRGEKVACNTGSGDVRVVEADTVEFSANSGSGEILFEADGSRLERVSTDTGSGDVTLRLGPDASFEAMADLASGDINNRYPDAEAILRDDEVVGFRRGDAHIRVRVDTGSGDLTLEPGR